MYTLLTGSVIVVNTFLVNSPNWLACFLIGSVTACLKILTIGSTKSSFSLSINLLLGLFPLSNF